MLNIVTGCISEAYLHLEDVAVGIQVKHILTGAKGMAVEGQLVAVTGSVSTFLLKEDHAPGVAHQRHDCCSRDKVVGNRYRSPVYLDVTA